MLPDTDAPTTPDKIRKRIRKFLDMAGLSEKPRFLPFTFASPEYRVRYCLKNCERESHRVGGTTVFGWMIWEQVSLAFIEAEFHAVVKHAGRLVDVTPRVDGETHVLFVPDPSRRATRTSATTWWSWSNLKSLRGAIVEWPKQIETHD